MVSHRRRGSVGQRAVKDRFRHRAKRHHICQRSDDVFRCVWNLLANLGNPPFTLGGVEPWNDFWMGDKKFKLMV